MEWTFDYYQSDYYTLAAADNPTGPDEGILKFVLLLIRRFALVERFVEECLYDSSRIVWKPCFLTDSWCFAVRPIFTFGRCTLCQIGQSAWGSEKCVADVDCASNQCLSDRTCGEGQ